MKKQYIEKLEAIIKQLDEVQEEMEALKGEVEQVTNGYDDYDSEYDELYRYLDETPDRTPFGDWYEADCALTRSFAARSVVGGVFMPFLVTSWQ